MGFGLASISLGAFSGIPHRQVNVATGNPRAFHLRVAVPWMFDRLGYELFFDFREKQLSRKPDDYWRIASESDRLKSVKGAYLKKTDLRYADVSSAYVVNANLRNADLRGARIRKSDFTGADLRGANLEGADLRESNFQGSDLREATLAGVNLAGTDFENAQLGLADLRQSSFKDTKLAGADLRCADLRDIPDLSSRNLAGAKSLYRAKMSKGIEEEVRQMNAGLFAKPSDTWHDMTTPYNLGRKDICE
jgi:uncharacterized protein YjbI with pentapeptide repeats